MATTDKDFPPTMVMSGTTRHRQNGEGSVVPRGVITEGKKGDWLWALLSIALLLASATMPYWLRPVVSFVGR